MNRSIILTLFALLSFNALLTAQVNLADTTAYEFVETMPQFPGGESALLEYMAKQVKYPEFARNKLIEGRVFVTFVIGSDGSVADAKVVKDIGGGCGKAALEAVLQMPKWNPGFQKGKAVRVKFTIPVTFTLVREPEFEGGKEAMDKWIAENLVYPQKAKKKKVQGTVYVTAEVAKDGSLKEIDISTSPDDLLKEEAIRLVNKMPKWKPGSKPNEVVLIPIEFKLEN
jgi:TonB family protein